MGLQQPSSGSPELKEEIRHTLAARQELGQGLDDELIEAFAQRIQSVIAAEVARSVGAKSTNAQQIRDWQKEMFGITLGCGIPLLAIAAFSGTGLLGIVVVCVMLAVVSIAFAIRSG